MLELDPDIAELMALPPMEVASKPYSPEAAEQDNRSLLQQDLNDFKVAVTTWTEAFSERLVPTVHDVPEGYQLYTNTSYGPFEVFFHQFAELQNRGLPLVFCNEAYDQGKQLLGDDGIGVYISKDVDQDALNSVLTNYNNNSHRLATNIGDGMLCGFYFDPVWRQKSGTDTILETSGLPWAESQGIAVNAFMASHLIREMREQKYTARGDNSAWNRLLQNDRRLYEQFAKEVDEDGYRQYMALSVELLAGLALAPLYAKFREYPVLKEQLGLTKPFPVA